ncbi:MAG: PilZ domain-containing protein, partial [Opitutales bacterium]
PGAAGFFLARGGLGSILPAGTAMRLFKKLFNFPLAEMDQVEHRLQKRYTVAADFPLALTVTGAGWTGPGRVLDVAVDGVGFGVDPGLAVKSGQAVQLGFGLDGCEIPAHGEVRYARPAPEGLLCGVRIQFTNLEARQEYLQLLIALSIGGSLVPVDPKLVRQGEPGIHKVVLAGESASQLTLWTRPAGSTVSPFGFELAVGDHLVRGRRGGAGLQTFSTGNDLRPQPTKERATQPGDVTDGELKRLYRYVVLNLPASQPPAVRRFLQSFA